VTKRSFATRVLELVDGHPSIAAITEPLLRARRAVQDEFCLLDRMARKTACSDVVCRRLMREPGVGVIVALTYRTGVDLPERFTPSRDMGTHFGLTPRRYSSGQVDYDGHISRCGDEMVRTALYQAAHVLTHHGRWSGLRGRAMRDRSRYKHVDAWRKMVLRNAIIEVELVEQLAMVPPLPTLSPWIGLRNFILARHKLRSGFDARSLRAFRATRSDCRQRASLTSPPQICAAACSQLM